MKTYMRFCLHLEHKSLIFVWMESVLNRSCGENWNTFYVCYTFFRTVIGFWDKHNCAIVSALLRYLHISEPLGYIHQSVKVFRINTKLIEVSCLQFAWFQPWWVCFVKIEYGFKILVSMFCLKSLISHYLWNSIQLCSHPCVHLYSSLLFSGFLTKLFNAFLFSPIRYTCPSYLISLISPA